VLLRGLLPAVHWFVIRRFLASSLLCILALAGCHSASESGSQSSAESSVKIYKLRGKVVSTNAATGEATLDHEAIPGFMEAMTMLTS
jgi:protein SCO1/2